MIFVDPQEIERHIPDDLKRDLQQATAELRALSEDKRKAFIGKKQDLWSRTKPYLAAVLGKEGSPNDFKCWYCEEKTARFTYHVDHFRPKNRVKDKGCPLEPGYWWLAFDYTNYRLCCEYCNSPHSDNDEGETRGKWDQFPLRKGCTRASDPDANLDEEVCLLIDPTKPHETGYLSFDDEGMARPLYPEGNFTHLIADKTIEVLNLNHERIVEARKQVRIKCQRLVEEGNREFKRFNRDGSAVALKAFEDVCEQILELVAPWSEFSAMARAILVGTGQQWVLNLLKV